MSDFRIGEIVLKEKNVIARGHAVEQEREVAISDLLEHNFFQPQGSSGGPYRLSLEVQENRLVFDIALAPETRHGRVMVSLTPFRGLIRDYFLVCDSYYKAIRTAPPQQIEALDMGRRALHDEGAALLQKRLTGKIHTDTGTARRLFTLICVMHLKG